MSRLVSVDWSRESFPYFFFYKIGFIYNVMDVSIPIESGLYFSMSRMNARWAAVNTLVPLTYARPLKVEFFNQGGTALQNAPFDLSLIATPAESGVTVATAPGSNPAYPHKFSPLDFSYPFKMLFKFRNVIHLRFSNVTAITIPGSPTGSLPPFLEFMIMGRYHPVA